MSNKSNLPCQFHEFNILCNWFSWNKSHCKTLIGEQREQGKWWERKGPKSFSTKGLAWMVVNIKTFREKCTFMSPFQAVIQMTDRFLLTMIIQQLLGTPQTTWSGIQVLQNKALPILSTLIKPQLVLYPNTFRTLMCTHVLRGAC